MKIFILISAFFVCVLQAQCMVTESSKFAEKQYSEQENINIRINVKKEHKMPYFLNIISYHSTYIVFGWGDAKLKKGRKHRVSYITLNDCSFRPFWSAITIIP